MPQNAGDMEATSRAGKRQGAHLSGMLGIDGGSFSLQRPSATVSGLPAELGGVRKGAHPGAAMFAQRQADATPSRHQWKPHAHLRMDRPQLVLQQLDALLEHARICHAAPRFSRLIFSE